MEKGFLLMALLSRIPTDWYINREIGRLIDQESSGISTNQYINWEIITEKGLVLMAAPSRIFTNWEIYQEIRSLIRKW